MRFVFDHSNSAIYITDVLRDDKSMVMTPEGKRPLKRPRRK